VAIGDDGPLAQAIGREVDQRDRRVAPGGASEEHVLELQIAVRQPGRVHRGQRLEDAAENRLELVDVRRSGAREALREGLRLEPLVAHPVPAVGLPDLEAEG
jgi:hypothetical protein